MASTCTLPPEDTLPRSTSSGPTVPVAIVPVTTFGDLASVVGGDDLELRRRGGKTGSRFGSLEIETDCDIASEIVFLSIAGHERHSTTVSAIVGGVPRRRKSAQIKLADDRDRVRQRRAGRRVDQHHRQLRRAREEDVEGPSRLYLSGKPPATASWRQSGCWSRVPPADCVGNPLDHELEDGGVLHRVGESGFSTLLRTFSLMPIARQIDGRPMLITSVMIEPSNDSL